MTSSSTTNMVLLQIVLFVICFAYNPSTVHSFTIPQVHGSRIHPGRPLDGRISTTTTSTTSTQLYFFGNGPKDDGSPGDYVCKDCGYVFTKGPAAWAALPDNYSCPPCGAPKRRFTKVPKGGVNKAKATTANKKDEPAKKKSWF